MAARQGAPVIGALCSDGGDEQGVRIGPGGGLVAAKNRPWTFTVSYRFQPSSRHFIGTVEQKQREVAGNQIQNTYHLFDLSLSRQLTRRWSANVSMPVLYANRNQLYAPSGKFAVRSIGDMTVGARAWLFKPPTESGGNVALGASLKLPTGQYNATGPGLRGGVLLTATADQSIQAGDGRVGFALDIAAHRPFLWKSMVFFAGTYMFNPADTNGVSTFRNAVGEGVMSVSDQYLWRGGISRGVPGVRGLVVTFGGRIEGVPVRDAFGKSNGFRRPGYAISADPGLMYVRGPHLWTLSIPWAIERNRRRSVPDIARGARGDAAFADYTMGISYTRRF